MLKIKDIFDNEIPVAFTKDTYACGDTMYVGLMCLSDYGFGDPFFEPYCDVTVNLMDAGTSQDNCAFIDTNNMPTLPKFLEENGIAEPTGYYGFSGFCAYPEYRFNIDVLDQHLLREEP